MAFHVNLTFAVFLLFARTARGVFANLRGARANRAENKRCCKSRVYMKHHPNGNFKNIMVFSALAKEMKATEN